MYALRETPDLLKLQAPARSRAPQTSAQTRTPPPPDAAADTANLFSTIPAYEVFGSLFDCSFLLAAGSCAFVRWFGERVNGLGLEA